LTSTNSILDRLKSHAQRWGWLRTFYRLVLQIGSDYLGINAVLVRGRLLSAEFDNPITLADIELRQIEPEELESSIDDPELDLDRKFVDAALERGDIGFGAFDKSQLVAFTWRTMTSAPHTDRLWVRAGHPYSYAYKSFTRRDYRGNRLLPALILYSDAEMLKLNYTHRVGFIALANFASLATGSYHGSRKIGYAYYLNWFGRYFCFRTRGVKDIGFELFERSD